MALADDGWAPAHATMGYRSHGLGGKDFGKVVAEDADKFLKMVAAGGQSGRCVCEAPLGIMDFGSMSIPGCWPLLGTVQKAKTHWFEERNDLRFPPGDKVVHLAFFGSGVLMQDIGRLQRENCDILLLAWLH